MSLFEKLTHVFRHCQYHIVWAVKYRYGVLKGPIGREIYSCIQVYFSQLSCTLAELNVQPGHVHLSLLGQGLLRRYDRCRC